jgi:hypothetical protein
MALNCLRILANVRLAPTYDMAYDLAIEGSYYLSPKSGKLERSDRG